MTQIKTRSSTLESFVRSKAFKLGLQEVRARKRANYDTEQGSKFEYEMGRQFGAIAPPTMRPIINNRVNPAAREIIDTIIDAEGLFQK